VPYQHLVADRDRRAGWITLRRPRQRNALSFDLMAELLDAVRSLSADPEVRVLVIGAAGPVFSAGHDLKELHGRDRAGYERLFDLATELLAAIRQAPQPVVAAVRGLATAGGCQLVACCDLVVAEEGAQFATPGVKLGLLTATPMVPLARVVGRRRALELLLTGDPIDARTAEAWGLVNRVVPAGGLDAAVDDLVRRLAGNSPRAVASGKRVFYEQLDLDEAHAYDHARVAMTLDLLTGDADEGIAAFLAKRPPSWAAGQPDQPAGQPDKPSG
jgi:enoyl-CoA hydratase/carnithine racemase